MYMLSQPRDTVCVRVGVPLTMHFVMKARMLIFAVQGAHANMDLAQYASARVVKEWPDSLGVPTRWIAPKLVCLLPRPRKGV